MLNLYSGYLAKVSLRGDFGGANNWYGGVAPYWNLFSATEFDCEFNEMPSPLGTLSNELEPTEEQIYGRRPALVDDNSVEARIRYKRMNEYITHCSSFLDFRWRSVRAIEGENEVSHLNLAGCVSESDGTPRPAYIGPSSAETRNIDTQFKIQLGTDGREYLTSFKNDVSFNAGLYHWTDSLPYLVTNCYQNSPLTAYYVSGSYRHVTAHKFRWYTSGQTFVCQMAEERIYDKIGSTYRHDYYVHNFHISPYIKDGDVEYDVVYDLDDIVGIRYCNSWHYTNHYPTHGNFYLWNSTRETAFDNLPISFTDPFPLSPVTSESSSYLGRTSFGTPKGYGRVKDLIGFRTTSTRSEFYTSPGGTGLRDFGNHYSNLLSDCYACSFLSSVDAIDKFSVRLKINQIEASQDLFGLLALVDVVKLLKSIRTLNAGSATSVLLKMLDLLADARLVYSFALAPTYDDVRTIVDRARAFRNRYSQSLLSEQTIHGKHEQLIPSTLEGSFTETNLTVRSKLRVKLHADSLLTILPLRAAGLLPNLSTLWEVIPFSFVADWVFPIGTALEFADDSMLIQGFESSYTLHSVLLEWNVPDDTLSSIGAESVSACEEPYIQYRYFDRFILPNIPVVLPSRILASEFTPGIPSWETAGALFYRLLRR